MESLLAETDSADLPPTLSTSVLSKIEQMFKRIIEALFNTDELEVTLKQRLRSVVGGHSSHVRTVALRFPGATPHEAWRFTVYLRVMELVHEALVSTTTVTKRDIYYRDPSLFGKQAVVNECIDTLAFTFNGTRSALHVEASAKGLAAGQFRISAADGFGVDGNNPNGILVPMLKAADQIQIDRQLDILVIEKEAVFHSALTESLWRRLSQRYIILTGKGYPDLASRLFLKRLLWASPEQTEEAPRCWGLVDYDPDGMSIALTYKYGSAKLAHEGAVATVPCMRWLGCRSDDIRGATNITETDGVRELTERDYKKGVSMLKWPYMAEDWSEPCWRRELQIMLMLGCKFEIEMVEDVLSRLNDCAEGMVGGVASGDRQQNV